MLHRSPHARGASHVRRTRGSGPRLPRAQLGSLTNRADHSTDHARPRRVSPSLRVAELRPPAHLRPPTKGLSRARLLAVAMHITSHITSHVMAVCDMAAQWPFSSPSPAPSPAHTLVHTPEPDHHHTEEALQACGAEVAPGAPTQRAPIITPPRGAREATARYAAARRGGEGEHEKAPPAPHPPHTHTRMHQAQVYIIHIGQPHAAGPWRKVRWPTRATSTVRACESSRCAQARTVAQAATSESHSSTH